MAGLEDTVQKSPEVEQGAPESEAPAPNPESQNVGWERGR